MASISAFLLGGGGELLLGGGGLGGGGVFFALMSSTAQAVPICQQHMVGRSWTADTGRASSQALQSADQLASRHAEGSAQAANKSTP